MAGPAASKPAGPLRVGILGAGMIATAGPGYLPGMRRLRGRIEVAAIASRTRSRAQQVARDWDIPEVYGDLGQMLDGAGLDAVVNLTPIARTTRRRCASWPPASTWSPRNRWRPRWRRPTS